MMRKSKVLASCMAAVLAASMGAGCTGGGGTEPSAPPSDASSASSAADASGTPEASGAEGGENTYGIAAIDPEDAARFKAVDLGGETFVTLNVAGKGFGLNPNEANITELDKTDRENNIKRIEEKYNCKITFADLVVEYDEIPNEVIKSIAAGQPIANFFEGARVWLPQLASNGSLVDLTEVLADKPYAPRYVDYCTWLGKAYGAGTGVGGEGLLYNRKMIKDAGMEKMPGDMFMEGKWSYDDFYNYCVELKSKLGENEYPFYVDPNYWILFATAANGVKIVDNDGKLNFSDNSLIECMEFLQKLTDANLVRPANTNEAGEMDYWSTPVETFEAGKEVAMTHRASWQAESLTDNLDFGFVPYPWGSNVKMTGTSYLDLPENYAVTVYDAGCKVMLKGTEKKGDLNDIMTMYMDLVNFGFMVADYESLQAGGTYTNDLEGDPRWFNYEQDIELFDWSLSRERFDPAASLAKYIKTSTVVRDIVNKKQSVRSTLEAQQQVGEAALKAAGMEVQEGAAPAAPAEGSGAAPAEDAAGSDAQAAA